MLFYKEMTEELIKEILAQVRLILITAIYQTSDVTNENAKLEIKNEK